MAIEKEYPGHPDLTGGGETLLHSHPGGAGVVGSAGSYAGNDTENRAIAHGLGTQPKIVFMFNVAGAVYWFRIVSVKANRIQYLSPAEAGERSVTIMSDTNFYVGDGYDYPKSANSSGIAYYWVALG